MGGTLSPNSIWPPWVRRLDLQIDNASLCFSLKVCAHHDSMSTRGCRLIREESPGWSFVMKNEDYGYEYPNKNRRGETESQGKADVSSSFRQIALALALVQPLG